MQTSFSEKPAAAFAGMLADPNLDSAESSAFNEEASAVPFGVLVKKGTADNKFQLFSSAAKPFGLVKHSHAHAMSGDGVSGSQAGDPTSLLRKGRMWVSVEDAVTAGQPAYARHTSDGGSNTQKGKLRSDGDVSAQQVSTVTPTAANTTLYTINVFADGKLFSYQVTSDGSATATEICDAFRTAMQADAVFDALIGSTGTATLILTGKAALSAAFQVTDGGSPGDLAVAATTPFAKRADKIEGSKFLTSTSGAGLAILELNLPA